MVNPALLTSKFR